MGRFVPGFTSSWQLLIIVAALLGSGCATLPRVALPDGQPLALTVANTGTFGPRPELPTPAALHRLTPEQRQAFLDYLADPALAGIAVHHRLFQYLERMTRDFAYEGTTFDASQTLAGNSGNCMALAILTTALAEIAGLEIGHQLMDRSPVFELAGTTVKKGFHIRTKLYDPEFVEASGVFLMTRPGIKIDYFPTTGQRFVSNLEENEYLAMIYQNLAVEALDSNDLTGAYWHAMEALQHVPDYAPAINTIAVANRRAGDLATAEFVYRYGIDHADDKLSLLKNFRVLLERSGRDAEARTIQHRLDTMTDPSPFHWFELARAAVAERDHRAAIRYYGKALELAPYLHEAYLGIAQANYDLGRYDSARAALEAAFREADKSSVKAFYQAKLASLAQEIAH
ncbi:MAG: tetratricopeptide repeat protein [Gammaproteobacteria bacterium]|nr:tetratricopeptide repeat protein [Gammaproteobacteria bacterium]